MGEFTTISRDMKTSFLITKYLFLLFIVMNMLSTIWVGIYNKRTVDRIKIKYPDDRWTEDEGRGHSAELWERLCITFLVFENIFNCMGIIGALQENYCLSLIYSVLMFVCALYGSAGKFIRDSVCSYLMPLIVAIIASIFAHQIRMDNYELKPQNKTEPKTLLTPPANDIYAQVSKPKPTPLPKPVSTPPKNPLISNGSRHSSIRTEESIPMNGFNHKPMNGSTTYV